MGWTDGRADVPFLNMLPMERAVKYENEVRKAAWKGFICMWKCGAVGMQLFRNRLQQYTYLI